MRFAAFGFAVAVPATIYYGISVAARKSFEPGWFVGAIIWGIVSGVLFYAAARTKERQQLIDSAARATVEQRSTGPSPRSDDVSRLERLNDLKQRGLVSDDEYERQRARIIEEL